MKEFANEIITFVVVVLFLLTVFVAYVKSNKVKGGEKMPEKKQVLAVLNENELKEFLALNKKEESLDGTMKAFIEQYSELLEEICFKRKELWDKIQEKYLLKNMSLALNRTTGEITER